MVNTYLVPRLIVRTATQQTARRVGRSKAQVPRVARAEVERRRIRKPDQPVGERREAVVDTGAAALQSAVVLTQQVVRRAVVEVDEELDTVACRVDDDNDVCRDDKEESDGADQQACRRGHGVHCWRSCVEATKGWCGPCVLLPTLCVVCGGCGQSCGECVSSGVVWFGVWLCVLCVCCAASCV